MENFNLSGKSFKRTNLMGCFHCIKISQRFSSPVGIKLQLEIFLGAHYPASPPSLPATLVFRLLARVIPTTHGALLVI